MSKPFPNIKMGDLIGDDLIKTLRESSIWDPSEAGHIYLGVQAEIDDCTVTDDGHIIDKDGSPLPSESATHQRIVRSAKRSAGKDDTIYRDLVT